MTQLKVKMLEPIGIEHTEFAALLEKENPNMVLSYQDTRQWDDGHLIDFIADADALLLTNRPLSAEHLQACSTLKYIGVAFTGIDHLPKDYCQQHGICINPASGYATHAVAELTLCLAIALYRQLLIAHQTTQNGEDNVRLMGRELFNKTVGIVGGGRIGLEVGRLFHHLGCAIKIYNNSAIDNSADYFEQIDDLNHLYATSDIISVHLPLTPKTHRLVDDVAFNTMKRDAIFINTARGPIADSQALINALHQEKISGAAIDVYDTEPPLTSTHPILKAPNIITTPHIAFKTQEAVRNKALMTLDYLLQWSMTTNSE